MALALIAADSIKNDTQPTAEETLGPSWQCADDDGANFSEVAMVGHHSDLGNTFHATACLALRGLLPTRVGYGLDNLYDGETAAVSEVWLPSSKRGISSEHAAQVGPTTLYPYAVRPEIHVGSVA